MIKFSPEPVAIPPTFVPSVWELERLLALPMTDDLIPPLVKNVITRATLARQSDFPVLWPPPHLHRQLSATPDPFTTPDVTRNPFATLDVAPNPFTTPGSTPDPLAVLDVGSAPAGPSATSRAFRRRVVCGSVFAITLSALAEAVLSHREVAEFVNLTTGIDPWMIALLTATLAGLTFDKLYPPED